ncbi:hypothetical protein ACFE04_007001 [Oxalis oulophora]
MKVQKSKRRFAVRSKPWIDNVLCNNFSNLAVGDHHHHHKEAEKPQGIKKKAIIKNRYNPYDFTELKKTLKTNDTNRDHVQCEDLDDSSEDEELPQSTIDDAIKSEIEWMECMLMQVLEKQKKELLIKQQQEEKQKKELLIKQQQEGEAIVWTSR